MASSLSGETYDISTFTIPELFQKLLLQHKDNVAVTFQEKHVTFQELEEESNKIACGISAILDEHKIQLKKNENCVAILLKPGIERISTLLATWKLGLAYVPLEQTLPNKRLEFILKELQPCCAVTSEGSLPRGFTGVFSKFNTSLLKYEEIAIRDTNVVQVSPLVTGSNPLVSVLYTSGSTGTPKGVRLRTISVVNRLAWQWRNVPFKEEEKGCHKTSMLFVDSLTEILSCLLKAVPLVIAPEGTVRDVEALLQFLHDNKVTRLVLVPTLLRMILAWCDADVENKEKLSSLRTVISSGEALPPQIASKAFSVLPAGCTLWNFYGSTEVTGDVTAAKFESPEDVQRRTVSSSLSIGFPVSNTTVLILDENNMEVSAGDQGQISVSGAALADGYVLKELNKGVFVDMKSSGGTKKVYLTGDRGMITSEGVLCLGRTDSMVKIRGQRFDMNEIDKTMTGDNRIHQSCTVAIESQPGNLELVTFFTLSEGTVVENSNLQQMLQESLPSYAQTTLMKLEKLPVQSSGKVDRQTLMELARYQVNVIPPATLMDKHMENKHDPLDIIAAVLGMKPQDVDKTASFADLGANSLSLTLLAVEMKKAQYGVTLADLVSCVTVQNAIDLANKHSSQICPTAGQLLEGKALTSGLGPTHEFRMISSLTEEYHNEIIYLIAVSFAQKSPIDVFIGSTVEQLDKCIRAWWTELLRDDLSICILDKETGHVIAATLNINIRTEFAPDFPFPIQGVILGAVEEPILQRLLATNEQWMDAIMTAADVNLPDDVSLPLLIALEEEVIRVAKLRGYDGIVTVNSHPITAMIDEHYFGFTTVNELHVKSFEHEGKRPLSHADDKYYLKAMVKRF